MTVTNYCTGSCEECMKDAPYEYCCKLECGEHEFCRRCRKADCCSLIIPMNGIDKGRREFMPKIITYGGDTKIGAYMFRDRKKPCICVQKGNQITLYGTFNNIKAADNFMNELAEFLGAKAGEE